MVPLFEAILEPFRVTKNTAKDLLTSRRTIKRRLDDVSEEIEQLLKDKVPKLARDGRLSLCIDHQNQRAGFEKEQKYLGVALLVYDVDKMVKYLSS